MLFPLSGKPEKDFRLRRKLLATFRHAGALAVVAGLLIQPAALALPQGWMAMQGDVSFHLDNNTLNITSNSSKAIISYTSFNLAPHETVNFLFTGTPGSILNQVLTGGGSNILGTINSSGNVLFVNPAGINFGSTARLNVNSLIASTLNMRNQDFLSGQYRFEKDPAFSPAAVRNQGVIKANEYVGLIGSHIDNSGTVKIVNGKVDLVVGDSVRMNIGQNMSVDVQVDAPLLEKFQAAQDAIKNSGTIEAHGINLETALSDNLYENAINNTGLLTASSLVSEGGKIRLLGGDSGALVNAGTIRTVGGNTAANAGNIRISGKDVFQTEAGKISADGVDVGGSVAVESQTARLEGVISAKGASQGGMINVNTTGGLDLSGEVIATGGVTGGDVSLKADGSLQATSGHRVDVSGAQAGDILTESQHTVTSGQYKAVSTGAANKGGNIDFGGSASMLSAKADASGAGGGGRIRVGGEYQGGKNLPAGTDELRNSDSTVVSQGTQLTAAATGNAGEGGKVIVWSDKATHFYGNIDVRPGRQSGIGGFVEVSGHDLNMTEGGILTGRGNRFGQILLDPANLYIQDAPLSGLSLVKLAFTGPSTTNTEYFGRSVALNGAGNILAVGASGNDTGGTDRGAVYLFNLNPADLVENPVLRYKLADGSSGLTLANSDAFGTSVALNDAGNILAVGANLSDMGGTDRGAVYTFGLNTADLAQSPTFGSKLGHGTAGLSFANSENFGYSVALNGAGNILAVGATGNDTGGTNRGAAYLFNLDPTDLSVMPTFKYKVAQGVTGLTLANSDAFGSSLALNSAGDILAVGANLSDAGGTDRGAAYLFNLDPADLAAMPIYRYKLAHGTAGLTLANSDSFGISLALNGTGDILAVGAHNSDMGGTDRGAAYLFNLDTSNLSVTPTLRYTLGSGTAGLTLANSTNFGVSLALNNAGNILAVGAHKEDTGGTDRGSTFLFNLDPADLTTTPGNLRKLGYGNTGPDLLDSDYFGRSLALNDAGNILAVGAYGNDAGGTNRGATYLFTLDSNTPSLNPVLRYKLSHGSPGLTLANSDQFGYSVSLNGAGDVLAVGANLSDTGGTDRGAVYLFNLNPANLAAVPTYRYKLANGSPGLTLANADNFGASVALNSAGDILAIGATGNDTGGTDRGAAYLFGLDISDLTLAPIFRYKLASGSPGLTLANADNFGASVALNGVGNILAVGASGDDTGGTNRGAVRLFTLDPANLATAPVFKYKIGHGSPGVSLANADAFGTSLALDNAGGILAVGTPGDDTNGTDRGSVRLFNLNTADLTATPVLKTTLTDGVSGLSLANSDNFGSGVALNADASLLAIGAHGDDTGGTNRGAAYLFNLGKHTYNGFADQNAQISTGLLATLLSGGNHLTLQASNDIFLNNNLLIDNPWGNGGNLTLQAGRSVWLNADIATDDGNLTIIANDRLSNGVVDAQRQSGAAEIAMAAGTTLNAGGGNVTLEMRDGAGKTYSDSGTITLNNVSAGTLVIKNQGLSTGSNIVNHDNASLNVSGLATLDAGSNAVELGNKNGDTVNFGSVDLTAGTVTLEEDSDLHVAANAVSGAMSLKSAGAITSDTALGATDLVLDSVADLGTDANNRLNVKADMLKIVNASNAYINEQDGVALKASTLPGTLDLKAGGDVTSSGRIVADHIKINTTGKVGTDASSRFETKASQLSLSNVANAFINEQDGLTVNAMTTSGTLDIAAGGDLASGGRVQANTLNMSTTGNIGASAASRFQTAAQNLKLNAANAFIDEQDGVVVNASTVTSALDLKAAGNVTSGGQIVANTLSIDTSGNIGAGTSSRLQTNVGTMTLKGANAYIGEANALVLGTSNITGTANISAGGNLTNTGILTANAATLSSTGTIGTSAASRFRTTVNSLSLSATNAYIDEANALTMAASNVSGTANISAGGNLTSSGTLTAGTAILSSTGNIGTSAASRFNTNVGTLALTANNAYVNESNALTLNASSVTGTANINAGGNLVSGGTLTAGSAVLSSSGNIGTSAASRFNTNVGSLSLSANNAYIGETNDLTLNASTVTGTTNISVGGNLVSGGVLTTANAILSATGNIGTDATSPFQTSAGTLAITGASNAYVDEQDDLTVNASTVTNTLDLAAGGHITSGGVVAADRLVLKTTGDIGVSASSRFQTNAGTIEVAQADNAYLNEQSGAAIGGTVTNVLDVTANGDLTSNGTVQATDIYLGTSGNIGTGASGRFNTRAGNVTVSGANDVYLFNDGAVNLKGVFASGTADVAASDTLSVTSIQAAGVNLASTANNGSVNISAGAVEGTNTVKITSHGSGKISIGATGSIASLDIELLTDNPEIDGDVNAGTGSIRIAPLTSSARVGLGDGPSHMFSLTNGELAHFTSGSLTIGDDATQGAFDLGYGDYSSAGDLTLKTTGDVQDFTLHSDSRYNIVLGKGKSLLITGGGGMGAGQVGKHAYLYDIDVRVWSAGGRIVIDSPKYYNVNASDFVPVGIGTPAAFGQSRAFSLSQLFGMPAQVRNSTLDKVESQWFKDPSPMGHHLLKYLEQPILEADQLIDLRKVLSDARTN